MTNARAKGVRGERGASKFMTEITGEKWRRTQQHKSAGIVGDIEPCDPDSPWRVLHIEVKNSASIKIGRDSWRAAWDQAVRDCPTGSVPVLIHKERAGLWLVTARHGGRLVTATDGLADFIHDIRRAA